jgi:hypothetical protein
MADLVDDLFDIIALARPVNGAEQVHVGGVEDVLVGGTEEVFDVDVDHHGVHDADVLAVVAMAAPAAAEPNRYRHRSWQGAAHARDIKNCGVLSELSSRASGTTTHSML